jgi:hypothetical protein
LPADDGARAVEGDSVRRDADDRDGGRPEVADRLAEASAAGPKFGPAELCGRRRGAVDEVRYPDAGPQ